MKPETLVGAMMVVYMFFVAAALMAFTPGCASPGPLSRPKMGKCQHPRFGEYNCEVDPMGRPK